MEEKLVLKEDWQKRLLTEYIELDKKRRKLRHFMINNKTNESISNNEYLILNTQDCAMITYLNILYYRLQGFLTKEQINTLVEENK